MVQSIISRSAKIAGKHLGEISVVHLNGFSVPLQKQGASLLRRYRLETVANLVKRDGSLPELVIHQKEKTSRFHISGNTTLLKELLQQGYDIAAPCGGNGRCGKCRVQIHNRNMTHTVEEQRLLSSEERVNGIHLACMVIIDRDLEITLDPCSESAEILTDTNTSIESGNPVVRKKFLALPETTLVDQRCDALRLSDALVRDNMQTGAGEDTALFQPFPLAMLKTLPGTLREKDFQVTVIEVMGRYIGAESGNTTGILYGIAVDIGTTTLAAYLYDLNTLQRISVASALNPQKRYGADVISRIDYSAKSPENARQMSEAIRSALNDLITSLIQARGLKHSDIYAAVLAGNTTMIHLLLELPAVNMATTPFIPVVSSSLILQPSELGLAINPRGRVLILPGVSAYIGADTVAAVLSVSMHRRKEITLLVDIGTNGEIVVGNEEFLCACSTAAGPAFEGANITCGAGCVEGAVSEVFIDRDGEICTRTIGGKKATGICGSGLIDAIACMLQIGVLDETGRILVRDELEQSALRYADRLFEENSQQAFLLETSDNRRVFITQKDVREVQNAKAAIAAGIQVIIRESGLEPEDIHAIYLAGGFGNYMRISSAVATGLLPDKLKDRIFAIGNAAGAGSIHALLSRDDLLEAAKIAGRIKYLELSSRQDFVEAFTDGMFFPGKSN